MESKSIVDYLGLEINDFKLYHENSKCALQYHKYSNGFWHESTYDTNGNELTFKDSYGYWTERTYDDNGNKLTYKNSDGYWTERTYDTNGNELTYKSSNGYWSERTYDDNGNELTYKNSDGVTRGFDKKEMTIEEIQQKLGYKIKIVE